MSSFSKRIAQRTNPRTEVNRHSELSRLLPLWPGEIDDVSLFGRQRVCRMLGSALRRERSRGIAGHWTYDIARHLALVKAARREETALRHIQADKKMPANNAGMAGDHT